MKYLVAKEHRDFFLQRGFIQFEDLLKEETLNEITAHIPEKDLWRKDPLIRKIVMQKKLGEIASELTKERPLRLAYDQLFVNSEPTYRLKGVEDPYKEKPLTAISGLQGISCGLMLCLEASSAPSDSIFCSQRGHGVYFSANTLIPFHQLLTKEPQRYLLIVYAQQHVVYIPSENHELKALGYSFGDRLKDKTHPLIIK